MASFSEKEFVVGGVFTPIVFSGMILAGFDIYKMKRLYPIIWVKRHQLKEKWREVNFKVMFNEVIFWYGKNEVEV